MSEYKDGQIVKSPLVISLRKYSELEKIEVGQAVFYAANVSSTVLSSQVCMEQKASGKKFASRKVDGGYLFHRVK